MLGMKYKCSDDDEALQRLYYNRPSSKRNEPISENIPTDMYDYLVRHGLVNGNLTKY